MLTKRCLSAVMVAFLVQPQLLMCGDGLDQKDEGQEQVDTEKAPVVTEQSDKDLELNPVSNEDVAQRRTEVTLPGGFSINTDNRYVQGAIALVVILAAVQYFGLSSLPHG